MGTPSDDWVNRGELMYSKRISHYMPFEFKAITASKNKTPSQVLQEEGRWLMRQFDQVPSKVILLDERGPQLTSVQFANKLDQWRQGSYKQLVFVIGSAYGFSEELQNRADGLLAISTMTLPHQLCRVLMLEQLYRACTILKGESYHHE
jgi:23S rRNA (pseudouridine1915-N3)-methyltransferase